MEKSHKIRKHIAGRCKGGNRLKSVRKGSISIKRKCKKVEICRRKLGSEQNVGGRKWKRKDIDQKKVKKEKYRLEKFEWQRTKLRNIKGNKAESRNI